MDYVAVYPRVCGGTAIRSNLLRVRTGLSPRVRGNRYQVQPATCQDRSIPACAGEPLPQPCGPPPGWVYPRVCGGTSSATVRAASRLGLSPRVRGNPYRRNAEPEPVGSIPACAGEPRRHPEQGTPARVYPRVCGGTSSASRARNSCTGLSPRVRGNPSGRAACAVCPRSIPACAGEPRPYVFPAFRCEVYPRVCGGTGVPAITRIRFQGLSPRVRGNLIKALQGMVRKGSIPACAGEPCWADAHHSGGRVYPRVCGGTLRIGLPVSQCRGLSPRVRGNLPFARRR